MGNTLRSRAGGTCRLRHSTRGPVAVWSLRVEAGRRGRRRVRRRSTRRPKAYDAAATAGHRSHRRAWVPAACPKKIIDFGDANSYFVSFRKAIVGVWEKIIHSLFKKKRNHTITKKEGNEFAESQKKERPSTSGKYTNSFLFIWTSSRTPGQTL